MICKRFHNITFSSPTAHNIISSDEVHRVMSEVDRGEFSRRNPYMDSPQSIGYGVTISAPHMVNIILPTTLKSQFPFAFFKNQ